MDQALALCFTTALMEARRNDGIAVVYMVIKTGHAQRVARQSGLFCKLQTAAEFPV